MEAKHEGKLNPKHGGQQVEVAELEFQFFMPNLEKDFYAKKDESFQR